MSFLSDFRLVSLFDTQMKMSNHVMKPGSGQERESFIIIIKNSKNNTSPYVNDEPTNRSKDTYSKIQTWIKHESKEQETFRKLKIVSESDKRYQVAKPWRIIPQQSCHFLQSQSLSEHESVHKEEGNIIDPDMNNHTDIDTDIDSEVSYVESNTNNSIFSKPEEEMNTNTNTKYTEECMKSDSISDTVNESKNKSDSFADNSSITDDEYNADLEETRIIVWRHITFHVIRSPVAEQPNILLIKIMLLHTKNEDKKLQI